MEEQSQAQSDYDESRYWSGKSDDPDDGSGGGSGDDGGGNPKPW